MGGEWNPAHPLNTRKANKNRQEKEKRASASESSRGLVIYKYMLIVIEPLSENDTNQILTEKWKGVGSEGSRKIIRLGIKYKARGKDVSALYRNLLCSQPAIFQKKSPQIPTYLYTKPSTDYPLSHISVPISRHETHPTNQIGLAASDTILPNKAQELLKRFA